MFTSTSPTLSHVFTTTTVFLREFHRQRIWTVLTWCNSRITLALLSVYKEIKKQNKTQKVKITLYLSIFLPPFIFFIMKIWLNRKNMTSRKKHKLTYTSFSVSSGYESLFTDTIVRAVSIHTITVLTNIRIASFTFVFVIANIRYLVMHSTLRTDALERPYAI